MSSSNYFDSEYERFAENESKQLEESIATYSRISTLLKGDLMNQFCINRLQEFRIMHSILGKRDSSRMTLSDYLIYLRSGFRPIDQKLGKGYLRVYAITALGMLKRYAHINLGPFYFSVFKNLHNDYLNTYRKSDSKEN